jgi:hypothetical protein
MTTGVFIMHIHTTLATHIGFISEKMNRCQPVHAIVQVDNHSTGYREVAKKRYGKYQFLHPATKILPFLKIQT